MVLHVDDILEELGPMYTVQQEHSPFARPAPPNESWLSALVGFEVVSLNELVRCSARPVAQVLEELSALELTGQIARIAGGYIRC